MTLRFKKATRDTGVDGHIGIADPRVVLHVDDVPAPLYPEDLGFWGEFSDTIDAACLAHDGSRMQRGVAPGLEHIVRNGADAARLVQSDWPSAIMTTATQQLGALPFREFSGMRQDFTDGLVLLDHLLGWAPHAVSPSSFAIKWHFMVPRPEEVAGAIARGELDAPEDIKMRLYDMVPRELLARDETSFSFYKLGCPTHPSYIAMHSAAAGAAGAVIKVILDLSEDSRRAIDLASRNMAYFRSIAGVHYPQDNRIGLWAGQEVVARTLPRKLTAIGFDQSEVEVALRETHTDWREAA